MIEIIPGERVGDIILGSMPESIPDLSNYTLEEIPIYANDGRRHIGINFIGYLFKEELGLICISLNRFSIKNYEFQIWNKKLECWELEELIEILNEKNLTYNLESDPYNEEDEVDSIYVPEEGLLIYLEENIIERIEIFLPR